MIICETERLIVRNWRDSDIDLMHTINSDEQVMEFFPGRRDRHQCVELIHRLQKTIAETGYGFFAVELRETGETIGFAGLSKPDIHPVLPDETIEIGWRLAVPYWGKGYATESAIELLRLGFLDRNLQEIVSFAVHDNHRSTAVMERIGLKPDPSRDFDHPRIPDTHPHLKRHVLYAVTRDAWEAENQPE